METSTGLTGGHRLLRILGIQLLLGLLVAFTAVGISQAPAAASASPVTAQQAAPLAAAGALAKPSGEGSTQAVWTCNWFRSGNNVDSYCTVYSGFVRQWAYCSGWGYIYSPWVGVGNWYLWTYCNGYPLVSWGYDTVG